jgi:AAA domain, putative AbiEii toxin, Type IV TA system
VKLKRCTIQHFTAFEDAVFEFGTAVNVLIGENGTGKSHLLKLLYSLSEAVRRFARGEGIEGGRTDQPSPLSEIVATMLQSVFLPDTLGRLVRRGVGRSKARIGVEWDTAELVVTLSTLGKVTAKMSGEHADLERAVFLPTREVLSIFPGFVESWIRRESAFDRTYYDLCVSLGLKPLRGPRDTVRSALLGPIEAALGATVAVDNGRFYLRYRDGNMEAPLVAEGHRKLAMVAYLIVNGSLTKNAFMFWDEPEANMNPKLASLTVEIIVGLANAGVQTFLATHDYVLASELSLSVESGSAGVGAAAFYALGREKDQSGVTVEREELFTDLQNNPILDSFAALHDRERDAFERRDGR